MEIVQVLLGGLGNQLFMLAAATEIARQTDCELSVYYDPEPDLQGRTLTINQLFPNARFVNAISPKEGDVSYSESGEELDDVVEAVRQAKSSGTNRLIVNGYFQNEKYFPGSGLTIRQQVRKITADLHLKLQPSPRQFVAVHVRRHDYATFGVCADAYFIEAMRWFCGKFAGEVIFYIFTDEPLYSRKLVEEFDGKTIFVNSDNEIADFLNLSTFKHFIISNSSFSWWGAYIGEESDSIIFAPSSPWIVVENATHIDPAPNRWCKVTDVVGCQLSAADAQKKIKEARYASAMRLYASNSLGRFLIDDKQLIPCLEDELTHHSSSQRHDVYFTAWAARKLKQYASSEHHDFGSCECFAAIASAQVDKFVYHAPLASDIKVADLDSQDCDLMRLDLPPSSLSSISCLHVLQHCGLGRYGDLVDPEGDIKVLAGLKGLVRTGGKFLFTVPMGAERVQFNSHRIYSLESILAMFNGYEMLEFQFIPDNVIEVGILDSPSCELVSKQTHGCGCFVFARV